MRKRSLFAVFLAVGLVACRQHTASPLASKEQKVIAAGEIGSQIPDFSVKDLHGRQVSSADLHGKVVLIDFWATWCEPCKTEMPGYQKLLDRYASHEFEVVGLKFEVMKDVEDPILFAKKIKVTYPLAVATDQVRQAFGGIEGLPTTLVYDRQGVLRYKVVGFEYTDTVESQIKPLL